MTDAQLPRYTDSEVKAALLAAGASGTVYSLVMPESEVILSAVVDGLDASDKALPADRMRLFDMYHEPWTQKQDAMHEDYFRVWTKWAAPVVSFPEHEFENRYPTAGASEGIYKLMAEYAGRAGKNNVQPVIHIFDGDYEGFPAFAAALHIRVVRHSRERWRETIHNIESHAQFWISQPSAIDGMVWEDFDTFADGLQKCKSDVELIPDLTYVGSVAKDYKIVLDRSNVPAFLISHSKPFGGYYHRVGGVLARKEHASLFGNKWFKNLLSLRWATEMMLNFGVHELPRKYRLAQEKAANHAAVLLGLNHLQATDVMLLATAPKPDSFSPLIKTVLRGTGQQEIIRLCVSPGMACLIAPHMAPTTAPQLLEKWRSKGLEPRLEQEQ